MKSCEVGRAALSWVELTRPEFSSVQLSSAENPVMVCSPKLSSACGVAFHLFDRCFLHVAPAAPQIFKPAAPAVLTSTSLKIEFSGLVHQGAQSCEGRRDPRFGFATLPGGALAPPRTHTLRCRCRLLATGRCSLSFTLSTIFGSYIVIQFLS